MVLSRKNILIIDDDAMTREIISDIFEGSGHRVFIAKNGLEGLELFKQEFMDVIFLDLNMPGMDGMEFIEAIKLKHDDPWAVIAITGEHDGRKVETCYQRGVTHFLHKPFSLYELKGAFDNSVRVKEYTIRLESMVETRTAELNARVHELVRTQRELSEQRELENFITNLSARFIRLDTADLGSFLESVLHAVGERIEAGFGGVCLIPGIDGSGMFISEVGIIRHADGEIVRSVAPLLNSYLKSHETLLWIGNESGTWDDTGYQLHQTGVRAMVAFPMVLGNDYRGFVCFGSLLPPRLDWNTRVQPLRIIADLFLNLFERLTSEIRIKSINELREYFLAAISHELRTPLTVMNDGIALLIDQDLGPLNEEQLEMATLVRDTVTRLRDIVTKILEFKELEMDSLELDLQPLDMRAFMIAAEQLMMNVGHANEVRVTVELPRETLTVMGNRIWLEKALLNLFTNAAKFTATGSIDVSVATHGNWVDISVKDTGPGIAAEDQAMLFEGIHQGGSMKNRKTGGIGLGLVITKQIVEKHNGRIHFESQPGKGSIFGFELPLMIG